MQHNGLWAGVHSPFFIRGSMDRGDAIWATLRAHSRVHAMLRVAATLPLETTDLICYRRFRYRPILGGS